jgi:phosphogluconate dehydratase
MNTQNINPVVAEVTARVIARSADDRRRYLERIKRAADKGPSRSALSCSNLAHGIAACSTGDKQALSSETVPNIAIVSAYNDMLSAHQPFENYPQQIKQAASQAGAVAQFAGGVPAMCDGVTQGQDGMDLSLFSRDVIALSTAVALSHDMFDAAVCLGICDKIVPGLLIGALSFGHLPVLFIPAGPMVSGLPNKEKAQVREDFAAGRIGREELLAAESASYHGPGTCTFYGTANSNQMMMEFLGLQLPGGSFVNPNTDLRDALTREAVKQTLRLTALGENYTPIGHIVDEKSIVNAIIGLLATGGSTNHTIHLVAIAAAAGIKIDWDDFDALSRVVPLLAHVYPNGLADVNHFHAAGGLGYVIGQLLDAGLLNPDVQTIMGKGLAHFRQEPLLLDDAIQWRPAANESFESEILRPVSDPFNSEGGLRIVKGNLGRAVAKVSAVSTEYHSITAPAHVFTTQHAFVEAFHAGELTGDLVAVVPFQGATAIGMPELHKLSPYLSVLQKRGQKVALLTDGRMSGASGSVLAAIQLTPEAMKGGPIGKIQNGDIITICAKQGLVAHHIDEQTLAGRASVTPNLDDAHQGMGRELFSVFRENAGDAEAGASIFQTTVQGK